MKKQSGNMVQLEGLVRMVYAAESKRMGINVPLSLSDEENSGYLGACRYLATQTMFGQVVDVEPATEISFSLIYLEKTIKDLLYTKRARQVAAKYIVFHTVRHELRHAWQTVHNKEVLMDGNSVLSGLIRNPFKGYGERPQEADANQYAQAVDVGIYNVLLEACTLSQDLSGKQIYSKEDVTRMKRVFKGVFALNIKLALGLIR